MRPGLLVRACVRGAGQLARTHARTIGARYVVTGYSKSKRSRWGLAQAEQLSVRQPTVTETRCGKQE